MNWNFKYVSFESILIILHEILIIVTHRTTFFHCFRVLFFSGTHCKGVSKQLCVNHLYRNVFLAQMRIRSHLGCIFLFRNSFQYPLSETRFETPFSSCCVYHRSLSIASTSWEEGFVTAELHCAISSETQCILIKAFQNNCVYHLHINVFLAQTRIRSPFFFPRFRKAFLTP